MPSFLFSYTAPMAWVSTGTIDPNKRQPQAEEEDEDDWGRRGGLQSRESAEGYDDAMDLDDAVQPPQTKRRKISDEEPKPEQKTKPKKKKKSSKNEAPPVPVGTWEKYTKGIGSKLLQRWVGKKEKV